MRYETSYHIKASGTGTINVSVRSVFVANRKRNTIASTVFAVGAIFFVFPMWHPIRMHRCGCEPCSKIITKEEHPP